jgi:hypothetical protein
MPMRRFLPRPTSLSQCYYATTPQHFFFPLINSPLVLLFTYTHMRWIIMIIIVLRAGKRNANGAFNNDDASDVENLCTRICV